MRGRYKVNWPALGVLVAIVVGLGLMAPVAGVAALCVIVLILVVNSTWDHGLIEPGIGDDYFAAKAPEDRQNHPF